MLTLYFLQNSRAFRIAWLLEELGINYEPKSAERREDRSVPPSLGVPTTIGKSPAIKDDDISVGELGAITEYLCQKYDTEHRLMPEDPALRSKVREYMWSAEGTFLMHGFAIWTSRSAAPPMMDKSDFTKIEAVLAGKVQSGFDWLENELAGGNGKLLVGNSVAAADTTLAFSIQFILAQNLGMADRPWTRIQKWIHDLVRHRSGALGTEPPLRMYAESGCGRINRHEWEEPNEGLILGNQYWLC